MKLDVYLSMSDLSVAEFAARLGVHRMTVYRYCDGTRQPKLSVLRKIYRTTNGQVTPNDFIDFPTVRRKRKVVDHRVAE